MIPEPDPESDLLLESLGGQQGITPCASCWEALGVTLGGLEHLVLEDSPESGNFDRDSSCDISSRIPRCPNI